MEDSVKEGLICPICHEDQRNVVNLQRHYEEAHSSEDKAGFQALKGFFGKAKRRLLAIGDEKIAPTSGGSPRSSGALADGAAAGAGVDVHFEPQEFGFSRSYLRQFKKIREDHVKRTVIETNTKIIRLEKMLKGIRSGEADTKSDSKKRKVFEQSIVQWAADNSVNTCLFCERNFGMLRRKHHCRLCGKVICNSCSEFISLSFAASLAETAKGASGKAPVGENVDPNPDTDIRTCLACFGLLLRRSSQLHDKYSKSPLVQLYDRMMLAMQEVHNLEPRYLAMAESLIAGEQTHSLSMAQDLKHRLIKQFELIDQASKRILAMVQPAIQQQEQKQQQKAQKGKAKAEANDQVSNVSERHIKLHMQIRAFAGGFLQDHMVTMPSLPDPQKLKMLQAERARRAEEKAQRDREVAQRAMEQRRLELERPTSTPSSAAVSPVPPEEAAAPSVGWQPKVTALVNAADIDQQDPLLLQRDVLRGYIEQARKAKKFDEVQALESSLKDIEAEIARSKKL